MVITCSTRPGRVGRAFAEWFLEIARAHPAVERIDDVDLLALNLPFLDEPRHPRLRQYEHEHTRAWSARVQANDAFVFVHPEYNHGMNAPAKNAIDYLHQEWGHGAVGFVSYGGAAAGTRAQEQLRQTLGTLGTGLAVTTVTVPMFNQFLRDGAVEANTILVEAAGSMLDELDQLGTALAELRNLTRPEGG